MNAKKSSNLVPIRRTIMGLPDDILTIIISNFSYGEISDLRLVCHRFNRVCHRLLNMGIQMVEKYHATCLRTLKSQLPRRESERRVHPLAKHCEILSAVETRLSLLAMTYSKYIDLKVACFIPGKVIDEAFRVLKVVMDCKEAPKLQIHDLLQELRDISSMAMEHFDEKIAPALKKKINDTRNTLLSPISSSSVPDSEGLKTTPNAQSTSVRNITKLQAHIRATAFNIQQMRKELAGVKFQLQESRKVAEEQRKKLSYQQQVIADLGGKVSVQTEHITQQNLRLILLEQKLGHSGASENLINLNYPKASDKDRPASPQEEGELEEDTSRVEENMPQNDGERALTYTNTYNDITRVLKDVGCKTETRTSFIEQPTEIVHENLNDEEDKLVINEGDLEGELIVEEEVDFEDLEGDIFGNYGSDDEPETSASRKRRKGKGEESHGSKRKRQRKGRSKGHKKSKSDEQEAPQEV